jgi:hypothetical protein
VSLISEVRPHYLRQISEISEKLGANKPQNPSISEKLGVNKSENQSSSGNYVKLWSNTDSSDSDSDAMDGENTGKYDSNENQVLAVDVGVIFPMATAARAFSTCSTRTRGSFRSPLREQRRGEVPFERCVVGGEVIDVFHTEG